MGVIICVIKVFTESSITHVIIENNHLTILVAISDKRDKMNISELREHLNLSLELVGTLL